MSMKIRLARGGAKKRPYYHIVVADTRSPRDGRFIEKIGSWNPMLPKDSDDRIRIDVNAAYGWIKKGALPTDRVARFMSSIHVKEVSAGDAAKLQRELLTKAGQEDAAAAIADPADPDAIVVQIVDEGEKDARPLYGWKAGNNPNKAEPGEKAKLRVAERAEKEEARKQAEKDAKEAAKQAAKEAKEAAKAEAEAAEAAPEEAPAEDAPAEES